MLAIVTAPLADTTSNEPASAPIAPPSLRLTSSTVPPDSVASACAPEASPSATPRVVSAWTCTGPPRATIARSSPAISASPAVTPAPASSVTSRSALTRAVVMPPADDRRTSRAASAAPMVMLAAESAAPDAIVMFWPASPVIVPPPATLGSVTARLARSRSVAPSSPSLLAPPRALIAPSWTDPPRATTERSSPAPSPPTLLTAPPARSVRSRPAVKPPAPI